MPIAIACPSCAAKLKVSEKQLGRSIRCPRCGTAVPVTEPEAAPAPPAKARVADEVVYRADLHWWALVGPMLYVVVVGLLLAIWYLTEEAIGRQAPNAEAWAVSRLVVQVALWVGLVYSLVRAILKAVAYCAAELSVTGERLLLKAGFLGRRKLDVPLHTVKSATAAQGLLGRLLGFGSVTVSTATTQQTVHVVAAPAEFRDAIRAAIRE